MAVDLELLGERIAEQAAHLDAATHRLLTDLREFDERGGWHAQGAMSRAHWLAWRVGWDLVTSRERVRVARKLGKHPVIDAALRRGEVSYSKVRAMLRVATEANEPVILEHARLTTAAQLEKLTRKYALVQRHGQDARPEDDEVRRYVRRRDTADGMVKIEAVLHPEEAELVWAMLDHAAKRLVRDSQGAPASHDSSESRDTPDSAHPSASATSAVCANLHGGTASGHAGACEVAGWQEAIACPRLSSVDASAESQDTPERQDLVGAEAPVNCGDLGCAASGRTGSREVAGWQETVAWPSSADDSAESHDMPARQNLAGPEVTASYADLARWAASGPAESSEVPRGQGTVAWPNSADDSAESHDMPARQHLASPEALVSCTGLAGCVGSGRAGSSAVTGWQGTVAWPSSADDSAESRQTGGRQEAAAAGTPRSSDGCASSIAGAAPGSPRSLLDRLLDEADALREAREIPEPEHLEDPEGDRSSAGAVALDPTRGVGRLRRNANTARRAFDRAEALISIAQAYLRGDQPNRAPIDVMITIPASELCEGAMDPTEVARMGASVVAAETARRLSCDAGVIEVIEDERGVPLSAGRKRRTIAGALKRALLRRDTECSFPGCANRTFLEGHHIRHWADGGETALENASLLCSLHHRFVHEYGYTIELGADARPQFRDPRGRLVLAVPARDASIDADAGWLQIRAANAPLAIDAETIACEWDGTPADYGRMIDHLAAIDRLA
ncbi:MAG TPA: DUF222 domain-containing protein [Kofleriaceae bacterium]